MKGKIEVRRSPLGEQGVFATEPIRTGERIGRYVGERTARNGRYVCWIKFADGWRGYAHRQTTRSAKIVPKAKTNDRVQRVQVRDNALDELALSFLQDVMRHPEDGVKKRYRRLGTDLDDSNCDRDDQQIKTALSHAFG